MMAYIKGKAPLNEQWGLFRKNAMKYKKRAANGARTRDPQLGKLMLYQLSYCRVLLSGVAGAKIDLHLAFYLSLPDIF